jgi:poly(3-hydroxybutyrate) depolymerase
MPKPLQQTVTPQAPPCVNAYAKSCCGGNVEMQADTNYNIVGKADSAGFIAVFPNGYSRLPSGKLATWNAGNCFRAIAPVAGTDGTLTCTPARPISVLHIHAKNDTHVLFNGGAGDDAFKDKSKVADFVSVPQTIARWSQRNRCTAPPKRVLEVPGVYCDAYTQCADGVQVQLCVTDTGGHSWPGVDKVRAGKQAASQALSANDVMWDFFMRVSQP